MSKKMNPEVKAKWLEALRNGKYKQGRAFLRTENGFCCLGVLCDLYQKEHSEISQWKGNGFHSINGKRNEEHWTTAPPVVEEWADFPIHESFRVPDLEIKYTLMSMNDGLGMNFSEIADVIEKQL